METFEAAQPLDAHNQKLLENVHPSDWANPVPAGVYNMVVIGAGTAGLVTAAASAGLGARVALIERSLLGGVASTWVASLPRRSSKRHAGLP
jgi:NADPH-dependent 2,4-dienoyl-CoA reductase/sulfur reductase-like enzyme